MGFNEIWESYLEYLDKELKGLKFYDYDIFSEIDEHKEEYAVFFQFITSNYDELQKIKSFCLACQRIIRITNNDKKLKNDHYEKYKDKYNQKSKEWAEKNKDKKKKAKSKYRKKFQIEYFKIRNALDSEFNLKHKLTGRLWKQRNPIKQQEYKKKFYKSNIDILSAWTYSKKNNLKGDRCLFCGIVQNLHFHHTSYEYNMGCTLCRDCHQEQHNMIKLYGWGVINFGQNSAGRGNP